MSTPISPRVTDPPLSLLKPHPAPSMSSWEARCDLGENLAAEAMTDLAKRGSLGVRELQTHLQLGLQHAVFGGLLAPLAFVSPRIITAIVDGTAPADLTVTGLAKALPYSWAEQERSIGLLQ